jgi:hypothetical protein
VLFILVVTGGSIAIGVYCCGKNGSDSTSSDKKSGNFRPGEQSTGDVEGSESYWASTTEAKPLVVTVYGLSELRSYVKNWPKEEVI